MEQKKKKVYLWFEKTVGCCQVLEADEEGGVVRLGGAEGREVEKLAVTLDLAAFDEGLDLGAE